MLKLLIVYLCLNKVRRCIQKTRLHNSIGRSKSGLLANSRREESSRRTKHLKSTTRDGDRCRRVRNGGDRSHGSFHASRLCYESRGTFRVRLQQAVFVCHSREESQWRLVRRQVRATLIDPIFYFTININTTRTENFNLLFFRNYFNYLMSIIL